MYPLTGSSHPVRPGPGIVRGRDPRQESRGADSQAAPGTRREGGVTPETTTPCQPWSTFTPTSRVQPGRRLRVLHRRRQPGATFTRQEGHQTVRRAGGPLVEILARYELLRHLFRHLLPQSFLFLLFFFLFFCLHWCLHLLHLFLASASWVAACVPSAPSLRAPSPRRTFRRGCCSENCFVRLSN